MGFPSGVTTLSYVNFNRPTRTPDRFTFNLPDGANPFPLLTGGMKFVDRGLKNLFNTDRRNLALRTDFLRREGVIGPGEEDEKYTDEFLLSPEGLDMLRGMGYTTIQDVINNRVEGGDNEPIIKKLQAPITEKKEEPKGEFDDILQFYGAKFEDGGEVRQNYGLGKLVKKVTKTVKKVAKSPLGKAAILAGFNFAPTLFGKQTVLQGLGKNKMFADLFLKDAAEGFALSNIKPFAGITAASLLAGSLAKQDEEEDETLPEVARSDPEFQNLLTFYGGPRRFAEDGGDIDKAPIKMASAPDPMADRNDMLEELARKYYKKPLKDLTPDEFLDLENAIDEMSKKQGIQRTMAAGGGMMNPNDEMLDLGGNEMDLRGGGFVPLGEYEKKDDVPARLSKNEFVFTADAVKAAGGGSVDRGADIMYKTMKNLENKVA